MQSKHKDLLDEMIAYRKERIPTKYLNAMHEESGFNNLYTLTGLLLTWPYQIFTELEESDKFDLEDEIFVAQYTHYFEMCPSLAEIFKLSGKYIMWADNLNEVEIQEIQDYILENHEIKIRLTRRYGKE